MNDHDPGLNLRTLESREYVEGQVAIRRGWARGTMTRFDRAVLILVVLAPLAFIGVLLWRWLL